jgi:hypothetical protein
VIWQPFTLNAHRYTFLLVAYCNRSGKQECLRLITTLSPVEHYKQRYRMESMFKHLKSNGFDLEALHLEYGYKIRLLMAVVVLAYTLAITYGLADFKRKVKTKKQGSPEKSVFRWGLDKWQAYLKQLEGFLEKLQHLISVWLKIDYRLINSFVPSIVPLTSIILTKVGLTRIYLLASIF